MQLLTVVCAVLGLAVSAHAHGRLLDPAGRATCWRKGYEECVPNYDDDGLNCGGYGTQWEKNGGKCGICGDDWAGNRPHEAGGKWAKGVITGSYDEGDIIDIDIEITTNHGGWHEFRLCAHNDFNTNATQACLDQNLLVAVEDSSTRWTIPMSDGQGVFSRSFYLPTGLTCTTQCILQWKWHCANSWDCDPDGTCCIGCGPQEEFYGCSDITIV